MNLTIDVNGMWISVTITCWTRSLARWQMAEVGSRSVDGQAARGPFGTREDRERFLSHRSFEYPRFHYDTIRSIVHRGCSLHIVTGAHQPPVWKILRGAVFFRRAAVIRSVGSECHKVLSIFPPDPINVLSLISLDQLAATSSLLPGGVFSPSHSVAHQNFSGSG
jgi:hypothetical protein